MTNRLPRWSDNATTIEPDTQLVTLVHGTWTRGTKLSKFVSLGFPRRPRSTAWMDTQSSFREHPSWKKSNAKLHFRIFNWSGANSIWHRDRAAKMLVDLLRADFEKEPKAKHIIIAHSHGGNVALRAMALLGHEANQIRLVTLATPFLRLYPREPDADFGCMTKFILVGLCFYIFISLFFLLATLGVALGLAAASFLLVLLVSPLAELGFAGDYGKSRPFLLADAADYANIYQLSPKILVLRGVDDEAALTLAAGAIGVRINRLVTELIALKYFWIVTLLGIIASYYYWNEFGLFSGDIAEYGVGMIFLIALNLGGLFKSAFGREFLLGCMNCDISADSVLDTNNATITTLKPTESSKFRHSIYDHPQCVDAIVNWINLLEVS
jgi:hypothetical protein